MHIGLYFGSFNPIHIGHLIVANHVVENVDIDKIWFVLSPHNPLKDADSLLNEYDRLHLVELAIKDNNKFRASNVEFHLPKPLYHRYAYLPEREISVGAVFGYYGFRQFQQYTTLEELQSTAGTIQYHSVRPPRL
jgi:nicotinate-nucleotide adenylyltransferase